MTLKDFLDVKFDEVKSSIEEIKKNENAAQYILIGAVFTFIAIVVAGIAWVLHKRANEEDWDYDWEEEEYMDDDGDVCHCQEEDIDHTVKVEKFNS